MLDKIKQMLRSNKGFTPLGMILAVFMWSIALYWYTTSGSSFELMQWLATLGLVVGGLLSLTWL